MPVIKNREMARIAAALAMAGARWRKVYRQERDANNVVTGPETLVGDILGIKYIKGVSSILKIDIPGTLLQTDVPRFEGVAAYNCGVIQEHDEISMDGKRYEILSAPTVDNLYYNLVLKE